LRRICAWCHKPLDDNPDDGSPITHGICEGCAEYFQKDKILVRGFLNTIDAPLLAVDAEVRTISASKLALLALNKEHREIEGKLCGEVIECEYSYLPGGCGKTAHCSSCQIRASVNYTRATGKPLIRIKALQHIKSPDGVKAFDFFISTERLGSSMVLLRLDEVRQADNADREARE
jgi:hypothetical protein